MDNEGHLNDEEIRLECIRLAVEFAPEIARITDPLDKAQLYYDWVKQNSKRQPERITDPLDKAETYYNWVTKKNSKRQPEKTASKKDKVKS